jgi:hypothetical protein
MILKREGQQHGAREKGELQQMQLKAKNSATKPGGQKLVPNLPISKFAPYPHER